MPKPLKIVVTLSDHGEIEVYTNRRDAEIVVIDKTIRPGQEGFGAVYMPGDDGYGHVGGFFQKEHGSDPDFVERVHAEATRVALVATEIEHLSRNDRKALKHAGEDPAAVERGYRNLEEE